MATAAVIPAAASRVSDGVEVDEVAEGADLLRLGWCLLSGKHAHQPHIGGAVAHDAERIDQAGQAVAAQAKLCAQLLGQLRLGRLILGGLGGLGGSCGRVRSCVFGRLSPTFGSAFSPGFGSCCCVGGRGSFWAARGRLGCFGRSRRLSLLLGDDAGPQLRGPQERGTTELG